MITPKPPRDSFATFAGLAFAAVLAVALGWAVWGPATRMAITHWQEVWVTIVPPGPASPHKAAAPSRDVSHA